MTLVVHLSDHCWHACWSPFASSSFAIRQHPKVFFRIHMIPFPPSSSSLRKFESCLLPLFSCPKYVRNDSNLLGFRTIKWSSRYRCLDQCSAEQTVTGQFLFHTEKPPQLCLAWQLSKEKLPEGLDWKQGWNASLWLAASGCL